MTQFWNLVFSGLVTGAIYSILASGLVLTYTTSGIFNFAHGAVAFATAYLYYQLNTGLGIPIVPSVIIAVFVFAPALGLLLDRILLRRLATAPVYARIVGTIGLLVALPNLAQWLVVALGNNVLHLGLAGNNADSTSLPVAGIGPAPRVNYRIAGVVLNSDQLTVFVVAALAAVVLWYVIRRTRIGLEMRAVVDRRSLASIRGVNADRVSAISWIMTMILAGLGGLLIAPLFQLNDTAFTEVVLGCLAAVMIGGLRSIPITFAGGLLLGVIQDLVAGYNSDIFPRWVTHLVGLKPSIPYVLVVIILLLFGRDRSRRAGSTSEDVAPPDHRIGLSKLRRRLPWVVGTAVLVAFSLEWFPFLEAHTYDQTVIAQGLVVAIIFLSFVVIIGMGGQVSLMQASFVTAGGFAGGWALTHRFGHMSLWGVMTHGHVNFLWATLFAGLIAAALGALLSIPLMRLGGLSFALGTLAWGWFLYLVPYSTQSLSNGEAGWTVRSPSLSIPGLNWLNNFLVHVLSRHRNGAELTDLDFSTLQDQILLFLGIFGVITVAIHALMRSSSGRAILAVRSSEVAAEASGIAVNRQKVMTFAFSAAIAGVGGMMMGLFSFSFSTSTAIPLDGLTWLVTAVLLGIRRPGGALLAGLSFAAGTAVFQWLSSSVLSSGDLKDLLGSVYFVPMLTGLGAIQVAQEPDGALALFGHQRLRRRRERARSERLTQAEAEVHSGVVPEHERSHRSDEGTVSTGPGALSWSQPTPGDGAFAMHDIVAGYGNVEVLHRVSLILEPGKVTALLGANGAGKSTLCSVAIGMVDAMEGRIFLDQDEITDLPPYKRARGGVLVVPEARGIFPGLTVEENLSILLKDESARSQAYERFPVLMERCKQVAGQLSGGEQQMLSLAPALANPPSVLIADEPTLGLSPLSAAAVQSSIIELRDRGSAVLVVEENAHNALSVADNIVVMRLGEVVWAGPREMADRELLTNAYLGIGRTDSRVAAPQEPSRSVVDSGAFRGPMLDRESSSRNG